MDDSTNPIATITPPSLQDQPMVAGLTVPARLYDRACGTLRDLVQALDRIADEGPQALQSLRDAQGLARRAVSDSVRELLPALDQAREAQDGPTVLG